MVILAQNQQMLINIFVKLPQFVVHGLVSLHVYG